MLRFLVIFHPKSQTFVGHILAAEVDYGFAPCKEALRSIAVGHHSERRTSFITYKAWLKLNPQIAAVENLLFKKYWQHSGMLCMQLHDNLLLMSPTILHVSTR